MDLLALTMLLNLAATWFMVGLIWFVQLVHYPQFAQVAAEGFEHYHRRHVRFTTFVVGPPMLVEAVTAFALPWLVASRAAQAVAWAGLGLVVVIWLSTALLQVPRHNVLAHGFDPVVCGSLCRGNWVRTAAWTLRGALAIGLVAISHAG